MYFGWLICHSVALCAFVKCLYCELIFSMAKLRAGLPICEARTMATIWGPLYDLFLMSDLSKPIWAGIMSIWETCINLAIACNVYKLLFGALLG